MILAVLGILVAVIAVIVIGIVNAATKNKEWKMTCNHCGKTYTMTPFGELEAMDGHGVFTHIPHWYDWQRQQVRRELEEGTYLLDTEVDIGVMVDYSAIYMVGSGRLVHDLNGFHLAGGDGKLDYTQSAAASHTLYSDYYWYEIDDVISIGDTEVHYFLFPKDHAPVAKVRLATEEMYKLTKARINK